MHGACADGVNCKYEHDVTNGPLGNTAPPEYYKCFHCRAPHWVSKCTSAEPAPSELNRMSLAKSLERRDALREGRRTRTTKTTVVTVGVRRRSLSRH